MPSFTTQVPNLHLAGPVVEVVVAPPADLIEALKQQGNPIPKNVKLHAMIDTGATCCVVNPQVIQGMGLSPIGSSTVNTPSSTIVTCLQYKVSIHFPGNFAVETSDLIEMPLQANTFNA